MTGPDNITQLRAMADKARALARGTTDRLTIDILNNYAEECDEQIAKLEAASEELEEGPG